MKLFSKKKKSNVSMKTLQPKRRPVRKRRFNVLHARTKRRQRAATTREPEGTVPNVGVARALVIILGLHVAAIGGIFFHNRHFENSGASDGASVAEKVDPQPVNRGAESANPVAGDLAYVVVAGDDYPKIAEEYGVDEKELRLANFNANLRPGRILRIPPGRTVDAGNTELAGGPGDAASSGSSAPGEMPVAILVKPKPPRALVVGAAPATAGGYVVQPGDSVWRLSQKFKVSQDDLMKANGIDNPRRLRVGMKLKIPRPH